MRVCYLVAICLVFVGCAAAADDKCANPVFEANGSGTWGKMSWSGSIKITEEPQVFPKDAKVCTRFAGQTSCCDANALRLIGEANAAAQASIKASEALWDSMSFDTVAMFMSASCLGKPFNQAQCKSDVTNAVKSFKSALNAVVDANIKCEKGVTAYSLGMMCFACKPNPLQYIDTKAKVLKIAQATCDNVFDSCDGTFVAYKQLIQSQIDLVEAFAKQFGVDINFQYDVDLCGGKSCKQFVCNEMISGLFSTIPIAPNNPWAPASRRILQAVKDSASEQGIKADDVNRIVEHLTALERTLPQSVTGNKKVGGDNQARRMQSYAPHAINQYSATAGYDAYSVGCQDVDGCGGMSAGLIAGLVVGSLILVLGAAFVVHRRRQASGSGSSAPAAAPAGQNYGAFN